MADYCIEFKIQKFLQLIFIFVLFLNFQFLFISHPFLASINLIFNIIFWIPLIFFYLNLNWLGYLICLLYLGGLLVLFIYFSSILPQKKFFIEKKKYFVIFFLRVIIIFFFSIFFLESLNFQPQILFFISLQQFFFALLLSLFFLVLILFFINNFLSFNRLPLRLI